MMVGGHSGNGEGHVWVGTIKGQILTPNPGLSSHKQAAWISASKLTGADLSSPQRSVWGSAWSKS